jgi:hypothetical protein
LRINRVHNAQIIDVEYLTQPMFYIPPTNDSKIHMVDITVTDEKVLGKFGADLTANFADIRAYGADAFFQRENISDGAKFSLCACATGYIWVYVPLESVVVDEFSLIKIQIGTFALKTRAITIVEIPCLFKYGISYEILNGQLALLCSTVLAKYLRLRMIGQQYEDAVESAIRQTRKELSPLHVVDPGRFSNLDAMLQEVCSNAPMPPTSDVSLISRSMITRRWEGLMETEDLRKRFSLPRRILRCFKRSRSDSVELFRESFNALQSN